MAAAVVVSVLQIRANSEARAYASEVLLALEDSEAESIALCCGPARGA